MEARYRLWIDRSDERRGGYWLAGYFVFSGGADQLHLPSMLLHYRSRKAELRDGEQAVIDKEPSTTEFMGWLCAYLLACGFALYLFLDSTAPTWCGAEDTHRCFREWVSALGGWAAVMVAIPTIVYLSKQVR